MASWFELEGRKWERFLYAVSHYHTSEKHFPDVDADDLLKHRREYERAMKAARRKLRKIRNAKSKAAKERLARNTLHRPVVAKASILIGAMSGRFTKRMPINEVMALAPEVALASDKSETIIYNARPKSGGGVREVWAFGPIRYFQQIAMSWTIQAALVESENDYSLSGHGGTNAAAIAIASHIRNKHRYWVNTDIKSAFPSITRMHFRSVLNLGSNLERYVVFPLLPTSKASSNTYAIDARRRELPHGAAHSSSVLSAVIGGSLEGVLPGNVVVVIYADNIAIGAQTIPAAKSAFFAIKDAFANTPSGLELHTPYLCDAYQKAMYQKPEMDGVFKCVNAIDFCGYRIWLDVFSDQIRFVPARSSWNKFWSKMESEEFTHDVSIDELEAKIWNRFQNWRRGFPLWEPNEESLGLFWTDMMEQVADYAKLGEPKGLECF